MADRKTRDRSEPRAAINAISRVTVTGYKSIGRRTSIDIRPLTLLAGTNSSGKSSIMQPLLLLKQTLEASYDPGALLLDGPNVKFSSAEQMFFAPGKAEATAGFLVELRNHTGDELELAFARGDITAVDVKQMRWAAEMGRLVLRPDMDSSTITTALRQGTPELLRSFDLQGQGYDESRSTLTVTRNRCFLVLTAETVEETLLTVVNTWSPVDSFSRALVRMIHVPSLRGNPERNYPVTAIGSVYAGTFEKYVASLIVQWGKDEDKIAQLGKHLSALGLTSRVAAKRLDDTRVELRVGRLLQRSRGGAHNLVNIADVGFGVSQTLPVVTALLAAEPGQLVYLEQPEIHLHPRARVAMAGLLVNAANRGVRVVAETHSPLLLRGVQTAVARGDVTPDKIKLHWFQRNAKGLTEVTSADLDETGATGDWPEDFDAVILQTESDHLDAAGERKARR